MPVMIFVLVNVLVIAVLCVRYVYMKKIEELKSVIRRYMNLLDEYESVIKTLNNRVKSTPVKYGAKSTKLNNQTPVEWTPDKNCICIKCVQYFKNLNSDKVTVDRTIEEVLGAPSRVYACDEYFDIADEIEDVIFSKDGKVVIKWKSRDEKA